MRRTLNLGKLFILMTAILFTPWFTTDREAGANAPAAFSQKALLDGVELYSLVAGQQMEFIHPEFATAGEGKNVHVMPIDVLVKMFTFFTKQNPPDEIALKDLTSIYPGWKPVFLPIDQYELADQILLSAGIIDLDMANTVRDAILSTGFNPAEKNPGEGYVAFTKGLIPEHYPSENVVIDLHENSIARYPVMTLESELNIPAFRWRIWHVVGGKRNLMVDWPVVVGKTSTRTRVAHLPMNQVEHYPPWTDPQTKQHVRPGPGNPLGLWKLKSTHTNRLWYYHGTNQEKLLSRDYRALSHGCIRNVNDNIRRLCWLLLSHNAGDEVSPGMASGRLDIFPQKKYRIVPLITPVMAKNVYDTIEVEQRDPVFESVVALYPNVYFVNIQDDFFRPTTVDHLKSELAALGIPEEKIDPKELEDTVWAMKKRRSPVFIQAHRFLISTQALNQAPGAQG